MLFVTLWRVEHCDLWPFSLCPLCLLISVMLSTVNLKKQNHVIFFYWCRSEHPPFAHVVGEQRGRQAWSYMCQKLTRKEIRLHFPVENSSVAQEPFSNLSGAANEITFILPYFMFSCQTAAAFVNTQKYGSSVPSKSVVFLPHDGQTFNSSDTNMNID